MNKQYLGDWVFHYNVFDDTWGAAKRENQQALFNDRNSDKVLKSKDIKVLIELIGKTNGDRQKINKLVQTSEIY